MHACWRIPELSKLIVEALVPGYKEITDFDCIHVSDPSTPTPQLRTLWAVAQTCRTLCEPALDVMWYFQFGMYRLLRYCTPQDLWEEHNVTTIDPTALLPIEDRYVELVSES